MTQGINVKRFDIFTDQEKMKDVFQRRLPRYAQGERIIKNCRLEIFRNKTLSNKRLKYTCPMEIGYALEVVDRSGRKCAVRELYAKAYIRGQSSMEFKRVRDGMLDHPHLGGFVTHLSDLDLIVWAFPHDPRLFNLSVLLSSNKIKAYFPYLNFPSGLSEPGHIIKISKHIMNYRAERRCLIRYSIQWGDRANPNTYAVFGKMFRDERGKEVYRRMNALYAPPNGATDRFLVARPLGYNDKIKTVWQEALQGEPLSAVIDYTNYNHYMKVVAKGIGNFHNHTLDCTDKISIADRLREVKKKAAVLAYTFPKFKEAFLLTVEGLERKMHDIAPIRNKLIHADFSIHQLLACGNKVAFFDYDEFAIGDPCQDLVKFVVDLYFRSFDSNLVELMVPTFLCAYQQHIGSKVAVDRFNWQLKAQCIIEAYILYTKQEPELEKKLAKIIRLSHMQSDPTDGSKSVRLS